MNNEPLHGLRGEDYTDPTTGQLDWVKVAEALKERRNNAN